VRNYLYAFLLLVLICANCYSQDSISFLSPASKFNKHRFATVAASEILVYGGALAVLSKSWYSNYASTSFHSFNDASEWLQIDKAGHFASAWYLGKMGTHTFEWSGVSSKNAKWYGVASSFLFFTGIEMLDGFSKGWGFSWSDFAANSLGSGFIIGQTALKNSSKKSCLKSGVSAITFKFSFAKTDYPKYRPSLLGKTFSENLLKDYNGQSYWMSFNLSSFMLKENRFPKWLNIAVGYGGDGMISGTPGDIYVYSSGVVVQYQIERYRQYYLSLDIDLTRIKTKSAVLKTIFEAVSFIKIPAPALELSQKSLRFHPLFH